MTRITAIGILIVAAGLEAGGDALMRVGLHTSALWQRLALFSVAGIVLFAYGWTVNAPSPRPGRERRRKRRRRNRAARERGRDGWNEA
jgi:hypothetical protein